jgi:hypothetical protein
MTAFPTTSSPAGTPAGASADGARGLPGRSPSPPRATRGERTVGAVLALGAFAVLGVALWLRPSPTGLGTHVALGLPPCGWVAGYDLPCPTCGMTTAFSLAARGSLWASFRVQPMGCLLAVATAATAVTGAYVAATGSRVGHALGARITPRVVVALACLALVAWGYKAWDHRANARAKREAPPASAGATP